MRVWIDLSNSPHPLLFEPLVSDLLDLGHEPLLTARDHAQTVELARERFPGVIVVGAAAAPDSGSGGRLGKARTLASRGAGLVGWAREAKPDVALSHNSYAQISAARLMRIPIVTAMDFEHQPANHLAFRLADRVLVPDALPVDKLASQGASERKLVRYEGFKEEVYLGEIEPDPGILAQFDLDVGAGDVLVLARSAPAGAAYHRGENPLFERSIRALAERPRTRAIVLARHPEQRRHLRELGLADTVIPEHAVDARSLLHRCDLFLGAGGTMSREAALLGVPAYSMFAGERPAVDAELERRGMLRTFTDPAELAEIEPRNAAAGAERLADLRAGGARIRSLFVETVVEVGG